MKISLAMDIFRQEQHLCGAVNQEAVSILAQYREV